MGSCASGDEKNTDVEVYERCVRQVHSTWSNHMVGKTPQEECGFSLGVPATRSFEIKRRQSVPGTPAKWECGRMCGNEYVHMVSRLRNSQSRHIPG